MKSFKASAIQYPSGRWGLAGVIPVRSAYTQKDGSDLTDDQAELIRSHGPGLIRGQIKSRTFATKAETDRFLILNNKQGELMKAFKGQAKGKPGQFAVYADGKVIGIRDTVEEAREVEAQAKADGRADFTGIAKLVKSKATPGGVGEYFV